MSLFQRHLADEHVKLGGARWATELESSRLEHLLTCSFPWNVTHVAWEKVPNTVSLDWGAASDAKAAAFVRSLAISRQVEVPCSLASRMHFECLRFGLQRTLLKPRATLLNTLLLAEP